MTSQIRFRDAGGTLRTAARIRARDDAGNLRTIRRVAVRDASGILREVFRSLAASLSPTTLSQSGATSSITTSGSCTVTVVGGTAPYTYLWEESYPGDGVKAVTTTAANDVTVTITRT
jgi:hypothetical protein